MNVLYSNILHNIYLGDLTTYESNLLFSIFARLNQSNELNLRADEVKAMCSNKSNFTYREAEEVSNSLCQKITELRHLFDVFQVDYVDSDKKEFDGMWIKLWSSYSYLFKGLKTEFTILDLDVFKSIRSIYTKTLFRLLSQYQYSGILKIEYDLFCIQLGIVEREYFEVNQKILQPSLNILKDYFKGIKVSVEKGRVKGKLRPITLTFTFKKLTRS